MSEKIVEEEEVVDEELKTMKDHIDQDSSQVKKGKGSFMFCSFSLASKMEAKIERGEEESPKWGVIGGEADRVAFPRYADEDR
ncbi:hypothetical protein SESBI_32562 [Sesbania bispinosa]|nr:hypothetical protein SESBI_32562 [Sesbania bispinosa]